MQPRDTKSDLHRLLWLAGIAFFGFMLSFIWYVRSEKQIDLANEQRVLSLQLAGELRQSSDDLTRMVRTYAVTGNPLYKAHYQEILDIRNGHKPRPDAYAQPYWDLVLADNKRPTAYGPPAALLALMRQAGVAESELDELRDAKDRSDALARLELDAMRLIESAQGNPDENRRRATAMLHDETYHLAKAGIMKPIADVILKIDERTANAVRAAEDYALHTRIVLIVLGIFVTWMQVHTYLRMRAMLGGSVEQLHQEMARMGQGDFSAPIVVADHQKDSVFGWLGEMQERLQSADRQRRQTEDELRIAAATFDSQEGMMVMDSAGVILRVNRAFTNTTGYSAPDVVGSTGLLLRSARHDDAFYRTMWEHITRTGGWQGEVWDKHKNGEVHPKWLTISAVHDAAGKVSHYVATRYDISERKKAEEQINALAFYDQLTGLPNRTLMADRLKLTLAQCARSGHYGALLVVDLDHFKVLNDTQGHDMGDLLLKQVAERVQQCIRDDDTAARVGGDEFVVILSGLSGEAREAARTAEWVAEKILSAINQIRILGDQAYRSGASIGVTLFDGINTPMDELLTQADLAMYRSKSDGRNHVRFFDPAMEADVKVRASLEADLRIALDSNQFFLHYQPQVLADESVGGWRVTGAEALVRWQHPVRGMVSPIEFIAVAESAQLIQALGRWVLKAACRTLASWAAQPAFAELTIAVNISAYQLIDDDFVEQVTHILKSTGATPQRLKLELTESVLVDKVESTTEKMVALKALGVGFSMDDFGTGYSSLSYLKRLPLDQLKIDQSFVRDILSDPNDAAIAKTIVALAQSLSLEVIAEGVETQAQREFLASVGCLAYQGYLFSQPITIASFEEFVTVAQG